MGVTVMNDSTSFRGLRVISERKEGRGIMTKEEFIQGVKDNVSPEETETLEQSLGISLEEAMSSFWDVCVAFTNCSPPQINRIHDLTAYLRSPESRREHITRQPIRS